jgi:hypothetical protein
MAEQTGSVLHVVERLNWRATRHHFKWNTEWEGVVQLPGATRLESHADPADAQRACRAAEEEVRGRVNPFACGGPALHYQTSLDEGRLHDWLLDHGVEPPAPDEEGNRPWRAWWDAESPSLSPEQRSRVWEALDKVRFHRVVERPARPTAFVVVRRDWDYKEWMFPLSELGKPVEAYSTREKAERARARREAKAVRGWGEDEYGQYEVTALRGAKSDPFRLPERGEEFAEPGEPLFFEVVEVEVG